MRNLLEVVQNGKPTIPLKLAAESLLRAAEAAGELPDGEIVDFQTGRKDEAIARIHHTVNHMGRNLGPAQNARNELHAYYDLAVEARYNFNDDDVCSKFGYFLLAVATSGFEDSDTTGTQMGEHRGGWRGGGFAD